MNGCSNRFYINDKSLPINENQDQVCSYWQYQTNYYNENFKFILGNYSNSKRTFMEYGYTKPGRSMIMCLSWYNYGDIYTGLYNSDDNNKWIHYEFDWISASNRALMFRNGVKIIDKTISIKLTLNTQLCIFTSGYYGYISEVLWAPYALHTENFTPPTEPYMWPETHLSLDQQNDIYGV